MVGMGFSVCPVCGIKHDEVVLLNRRLRNTLTPNEFMDWVMCPEHKKLMDDGYIALIEVKNQPKNFQDADRTGNIAHIYRDAWDAAFTIPAPAGPIAFVEEGILSKFKPNETT